MEQAHSLDGHIADLAALLRALDLSRITLVGHDWGGPTGFGFALSNLARVRALVVMSTWAWPLPPAEFHTRVFPWRMMHAPLIGPYLLGRHNALAGRGIYLSVVDREKFRTEAQPAYEAVLPDPATRLLTWTWPRWIPLDETARATARFRWLEQELRACRLPATIIWGREDDVFDQETFGSRFKQLLPQAEGPHLVTGRHFLQERLQPQRSRHSSSIFCNASVRGTDMATIRITTEPDLTDTRRALVLAEDRVGHYPEFRAFFAQAFDLDRSGPGLDQATSPDFRGWCTR